MAEDEELGVCEGLLLNPLALFRVRAGTEREEIEDDELRVTAAGGIAGEISGAAGIHIRRPKAIAARAAITRPMNFCDDRLESVFMVLSKKVASPGGFEPPLSP